MQKLIDSFKEVISSVTPMVILILILGYWLAPFPRELMISFIGGAIMMMLGLALFLFGAGISMMDVGERVGSFLLRKQNLWWLIGIGFVIGVAITAAEPDVQVLAGQISAVSDGNVGRMLMITVVGLGVGVYLVIGLLQILFQIKLIYILMAGYGLAFLLAVFAHPTFVPLAFDSGGVTTGPMTVPFILALATGIASSISSSEDDNNSFGMVGIASLGPILAVLILGVIYR